MTTNLAPKMNTNLTPKFALAVLLALLATASIRAGTITVGSLPATGTDAATGISSANTYVCCLDFGSDNRRRLNINSVPFQAFRPHSVNQPSAAPISPHGGTYTLDQPPTASGTAEVVQLALRSHVAADGSTQMMLNDRSYVAIGRSAVGHRDYYGLNGGLIPRRSTRCAFTIGNGAPRTYRAVNDVALQWRGNQPVLFAAIH